MSDLNRLVNESNRQTAANFMRRVYKEEKQISPSDPEAHIESHERYRTALALFIFFKVGLELEHCQMYLLRFSIEGI